MSWWVNVTVRGQRDEIDGPSTTKEDAEQQLAVIRDALGTVRAPDLPWLAVQGKDILSARVRSDENVGIG